MRTIAGGVIVAVLVAVSRGAAADPAHDEAERLIRHGIELRKAQDDDAALKEFAKAYALVPSPRAAAQLGLAEQALGRWEDADAHLSEALRAAADPWINKNRKTLEEALATIKDHIARVEVMGDPPGAEVLVNGRPAGHLPLADPVTVSIGEVAVELRAPGYVPASRTFTLVPGQYQRVVLRLAKEGAPVPEKETPTPVTPVGPVARPPEPPPSAPEPISGRRIAKWTALGLTVAALATGVAATVLRSSNVSKVTDQHCFDHNGQAVDANGAPVAGCQGPLDASKTDRTLQIVGFAATGAFAATWLVLTLTEPEPAAIAKHARAALVCGPSMMTAGVTCEGRF
jgi:hypothetical protein